MAGFAAGIGLPSDGCSVGGAVLAAFAGGATGALGAGAAGGAAEATGLDGAGLAAVSLAGAGFAATLLPAATAAGTALDGAGFSIGFFVTGLATAFAADLAAEAALAGTDFGSGFDFCIALADFAWLEGDRFLAGVVFFGAGFRLGGAAFVSLVFFAALPAPAALTFDTAFA